MLQCFFLSIKSSYILEQRTAIKTKLSTQSMSQTTLKSSHFSTLINPFSFLSLVFFHFNPTASQPMSFANTATHQHKHSMKQDAYRWTSTYFCYLNVLKYGHCFVIYIALTEFNSFMNVRLK